MNERDRSHGQGPQDMDAFIKRVQEYIQMSPSDHEWETFAERTKQAFGRLILLHANPETSPSHPDRLREMGGDFQYLRESKGRTIEMATQHSGLSWIDIALFEGGLMDPRDQEPDFFDKIEMAYDDTEFVLGFKLMNPPGGDTERRGPQIP